MCTEIFQNSKKYTKSEICLVPSILVKWYVPYIRRGCLDPGTFTGLIPVHKQMLLFISFNSPGLAIFSSSNLWVFKIVLNIKLCVVPASVELRSPMRHYLILLVVSCLFQKALLTPASHSPELVSGLWAERELINGHESNTENQHWRNRRPWPPSPCTQVWLTRKELLTGCPTFNKALCIFKALVYDHFQCKVCPKFRKNDHSTKTAAP
jgi:hypothetical protein